MRYKRITLLCGHYGSGKTNIAVNMAFDLKRQVENTAIADLDIVNPYFRTKDSQRELEAAGIRVIVSEFANSNVDIPAMPQAMYSLIDDRSQWAVADIGGDDRGAYALGRLAPALKAENDFDMFLVVNRFRPLTPDAASVMEVKREIELAASLPFTGIINNSNLGAETTAEDILSSVDYAREIVSLTGLPLIMTCAEESLARELSGRLDNVFTLHLQKRPV